MLTVDRMPLAAVPVGVIVGVVSFAVPLAMGSLRFLRPTLDRSPPRMVPTLSNGSID